VALGGLQFQVQYHANDVTLAVVQG